MAPDFVVAVNSLTPICCYIGSDMPFLHISNEQIVALLGAMADEWV